MIDSNAVVSTSHHHHSFLGNDRIGISINMDQNLSDMNRMVAHTSHHHRGHGHNEDYEGRNRSQTHSSHGHPSHYD